MTRSVYHIRDLCVRHVGSSTQTPCILKDFALDVGRGEQIAVIGPSGAGKTTLLAALSLARQPDGGTLELFGAQPWSLPSGERHALRRRLFLAPQAPPLPPRQRVVTAVMAGKLPHWSLSQALASLIYPRQAQLAASALAPFDLQDKLYSRVDRLSGGERQRVSLARLLLADAEVLLADEPLSALDPRLARQTLQALQTETSRRGATLICSLHQVELAHAQFARVIGLRDGVKCFDLPRNEVTEEMLVTLFAGAEEEEAPADSGPAGAAAAALVRDPRCR
jgi:phosphonate transport system ATP-binding protein